MNLSNGIEPYILAEAQNIELFGNSFKTDKFTVKKTLRNGGKVCFKIFYRPELQDFCLLQIFLMNVQDGISLYTTSLPNNETMTGVQTRELELPLWDTGDYYFFFKMSSNTGKIYIEKYQLFWLFR